MCHHEANADAYSAFVTLATGLGKVSCPNLETKISAKKLATHHSNWSNIQPLCPGTNFEPVLFHTRTKMNETVSHRSEAVGIREANTHKSLRETQMESKIIQSSLPGFGNHTLSPTASMETQ